MSIWHNPILRFVDNIDIIGKEEDLRFQDHIDQCVFIDDEDYWPQYGTQMNTTLNLIQGRSFTTYNASLPIIM